MSPDRAQSEYYQQERNQNIADKNYEESRQDCANLQNKINGLKDDRSLSFTDRRNNVAKKLSLRYNYEANCMSDDKRQNTVNKREERNIERRLQTIERKQQAEDLKRFGIGF